MAKVVGMWVEADGWPGGRGAYLGFVRCEEVCEIYVDRDADIATAIDGIETVLHALKVSVISG